jgi:hypothetical protein
MFFPMSTFNGVNSGTMVEQLTRLHLGETFYLLEITQKGEINPRYVLESEGHQEGYSLDYFFSSLASRAMADRLGDCLIPHTNDSDRQGEARWLRSFLHNLMYQC